MEAPPTKGPSSRGESDGVDAVGITGVGNHGRGPNPAEARSILPELFADRPVTAARTPSRSGWMPIEPQFFTSAGVGLSLTQPGGADVEAARADVAT